MFTTAASDEVRLALLATRCPVIDFFDLHMQRVESILGVRGARTPSQLHAVGDIKRYNDRMAAVEYAIEHDDGQSVRGLDKADVILLAPSRCGKTPTSMYLALQHGLFVANYPIVDEDMESLDLPRPVRDLRDHCFGLLTSPQRLSTVRQERRPDSRYASMDQCRLRAAADRGHVPPQPAAGSGLLHQVHRGDRDDDPAAPQEAAVRPGHRGAPDRPRPPGRRAHAHHTSTTTTREQP